MECVIHNLKVKEEWDSDGDGSDQVKRPPDNSPVAGDTADNPNVDDAFIIKTEEVDLKCDCVKHIPNVNEEMPAGEDNDKDAELNDYIQELIEDFVAEQPKPDEESAGDVETGQTDYTECSSDKQKSDGPKKAQRTCNVCGKAFKKRRYLTYHMLSHGEKRHPCKVCDKKFADPKRLSQHMRVHVEIKPYECSQCEARYLYDCGLQRHMLKHTGEKPHHCTVCDGRFTSKLYLKRHMLKHTDERKPYMCDFCPTDGHVSMHTGHGNRKCGKMFFTEIDLNRHKNRHMSKHKLHVCQICERQFSYEEQLSRHMALHTEQRPYGCDHCKMRFWYKSNLNRHVRMHKGEKPHICGICERPSYRNDYLKKHLLTHNSKV